MACVPKEGKPRPQWTAEASKKTSLYVSGLNSSMTKEDLHKIFAEIGTVSDIRIMNLYYDGVPPRHYAYVQYNDNKAAVEAIERLGKQLYKENIDVSVLRYDHTWAKGCDTVFVNYIDLSTTKENDLLKIYKEFGSIRRLKLKKKKKGIEGYAVIQYDKEEEAEEAILRNESNSSPYICRRERSEKIRERRSRSVFVSNLTSSDRPIDLTNVFERYGTISEVKIVFNPCFEETRGFGYIEFEKPEVASSVVGVQTSPNGNVWNVELVSHKYEREAGLRIKYEEADSTLYVKNLDPVVGEVQLRGLFSEFGTIAYCKVVLLSDGMSAKFGFVAFSTHEEAVEAMKKMNGVEAGGRPMIISMATRKEKNANGKLKNLDLAVQ